MAMTKGISLQCSVKFIKERFGQDHLNRILEAMEPAEREVLQNIAKVKTMGDYPQGILNHILEIMAAMLGNGNYSVCEEEGAFEAQETFSGIFKVFIAAGNPHFLIRQGPLAWRTLNSSGNLEILELHDHSAVTRISNFDEPHIALCHYLSGYFKKLLEMSGGKNVRVMHTKCRWKNDPSCDYIVEWE